MIFTDQKLKSKNCISSQLIKINTTISLTHTSTIGNSIPWNPSSKPKCQIKKLDSATFSEIARRYLALWALKAHAYSLPLFLIRACQAASIAISTSLVITASISPEIKNSNPWSNQSSSKWKIEQKGEESIDWGFSGRVDDWNPLALEWLLPYIIDEESPATNRDSHGRYFS